MDISVIVCTYNRSHLLKGNLEALSCQQVQPGCEWEVVVVDNNCTDDTARVVARAAEKFPTAIRRVEESKQGLSNARNRGIAEGRGRYLLFTDDDTVPRPDWVQSIVETFEQNSCDAVGGRVDIIWPAARPPWFADEMISSLAGVDYGQLEIELTSEQPLLGANMAFKRMVFERCGGFDPELGRIGNKLLGGEETELFGRLCKAGLSGKYQPRAVVGHVIEQERVRKRYFRKIYFYGGQSRGRGYTAQSARRIVGIPTFAFRQFCQKIASILTAVVIEKPEQSFMKELQAWWLLGFMTGCSMARTTSRR